MPTIILFVLIAAGLIIAVDSLRQRRIRATRAIDLRGLVTTRLAEPTAPVLATALGRALAERPVVRADVYVRLAGALEIADRARGCGTGAR